jgi:hypothetical protein
MLSIFFNLMFVISIFFEMEMLSVFIIFQACVEFTQLDQKRMQYNRIERFIEKCWLAGKIFYFAMFTFMTVAYIFVTVAALGEEKL